MRFLPWAEPARLAGWWHQTTIRPRQVWAVPQCHLSGTGRRFEGMRAWPGTKGCDAMAERPIDPPTHFADGHGGPPYDG